MQPLFFSFRSTVPKLKKNVLMKKWHLIENQPRLKQIYKELSFYHTSEESLKIKLIKAKLQAKNPRAWETRC